MRATPRRPDVIRRVPRLTPRTWLTLLVAFVVSLVVVRVIPSGGGEQVPPLRPLLLTAILITGVMTAALYLSIRRDLGLPIRVAVLAAAFNGLVLIVKFALAPRGLYQVNRDVDLSAFAPLDHPAGAILAAGFVFLLYLLAYWVIYRMARRRLGDIRGSQKPRPERGGGRYLVLALVAGALVFSGGAGVVLVLPLLVASGGVEYLRFIFASSMSGLIALALAGATALAAAALGDTAERARVLGDASILVNFFWLGLYFLALYHVLWVVYILVLTSIWPLKVVVPK